MTRDQKIVAAGAFSGVAIMIASVLALSRLLPIDPRLDQLDNRLAFTLRLAAIAVLPLLAGVMVVGNNRFLSEAIDPTLHKESAATEINGRVADNTTQQTVLFLAGALALSTKFDASQMRLLTAATAVFVGARIAFWIGYRIHPLYRAPGMAATGYLNLSLIGFAIWKFLT